jgi:hypothetical protein
MLAAGDHVGQAPGTGRGEQRVAGLLDGEPGAIRCPAASRPDCYPSRSAAVKILSMTSAPVVMTGRSSCR